MNITTCKAIYQCCLAVFLVLPTMHPAAAQGYPSPLCDTENCYSRDDKSEIRRSS